MSGARTIASPDVITRRVLFAVEVLDPLSRALIHAGLTVKAAGVVGDPIVNASGRFVWLAEAPGTWPTSISITPEGLPYVPVVQAVTPPADVDSPTIEERRIRVTLRPTTAYPFDAGVTSIRGRVLADAMAAAAPIAGALVQLAWRAKGTGVWTPAPPAGPIGDDPPLGEMVTDARGEFVAFIPGGPSSALADMKDGLLKVRLQITRSDVMPRTRVTADDFPFLPDLPAFPGDTPQDTTARNDARKGRIPEGQLLTRDLTLAWSALSPA